MESKLKMRWKLSCGLILCVLVGGVMVFGGVQRSAQRGRRQQANKVCFDPSAPCPSTAHFEPHDLPFRVPANAVIWESEEFYAVVLKSMRVPEGNCERFVSEQERQEVQALFPKMKVFASRCAEPASLYYTNIAPNQQFMAVAAGRTRAEAMRALAAAKATGKFPGANLRRMRAGFNGT
ncbi:MAG TPA: hypothetical protein VGB73_09000 [Pyrinomonadaceae bacterium]|jgi:hypothetical protein